MYYHVAVASFIDKPTIKSKTGIYATIGESLELTCSLVANAGISFRFKWIYPPESRAKQVGIVYYTDLIQNALHFNWWSY